MSGSRVQATAIVLVSGGIYAVVLLALQLGGAILLSGTAVLAEGAAALLILVGIVPAVAGSAVAVSGARGRAVPPGPRRLAATVGPPLFALLGVVLVLVADVGFAAPREMVTVLIAAMGGWAGGLLGERVSRR